MASVVRASACESRARACSRDSASEAHLALRSCSVKRLITFVSLHSIHEAPPHAVPAVTQARLFIDVTFPFSSAEQKWRQYRSGLLCHFHRCPQLRCPLVNGALADGACGLVSLNVDIVFFKVCGCEAQPIAPASNGMNAGSGR
jgi:hypothetical protein